MHHLSATSHHCHCQWTPLRAIATSIHVVHNASATHTAKFTDQFHIVAPHTIHQGCPAMTVRVWETNLESHLLRIFCKARVNSKTTPRVLRFIYLLGFDPTPSRPHIVEVHINICSGATCWRLLVTENLQYICPSDRVAFLYKPTGMQID